MRSARPARLPILTAVLAVAAACAPAPSPAVPEPRAPALILEPAETRALAALLRMEDRRELDRDLLAEALTSAQPEVRRRAVLAAGRVGDTAAAPLLRRQLRDTAAVVRAEAAFALGLLEDTASVAQLAALAADAGTAGSPPPAVEAVAALGRIGNGEARHVLYTLLQDAAAADIAARAGSRPDGGAPVPPPVAREALLVIWRFPRESRTAALVVPFTAAPDTALRWAAAYALMRLADPAAAARLVEVLGSEPAPEVRALAARGLPAPVADSGGVRETALRALIEAAGDEHAHVRINALRALSGYGAAVPAAVIVAGLRDPDRNVRAAAAEAAGAFGDAPAGLASALRALLDDAGADPLARRIALTSFLRLAPDAGLPHLEVAARSRDWLDRLYAGRALAAAPWPDALPSARALAADADLRVAAVALDALASRADLADRALHGLLLEALAAAHAPVRAAALRGLQRLAEPTDLPLILDAYEAARGDATADAALAALDALGALAETGLPVARAFYRRFPRPADRRVHERARERLGAGDWGEPAPPGAGRGLSFYQRLVADLIAPELAGEPRPRVAIETAGGEIVLELFGADAPLTVHNLLSLARTGYYDGARWHRVVPNFVLQDGDPRGDGLGGPGYAIRDELNRVRYGRGTVGMALAGPDTGGSQFFITHSPQPHLDGGYTVFGRVAAGMDVADLVVQDDPIAAIRPLP